MRLTARPDGCTLNSHVIALDELGGLQTLFVSFAARMAQRDIRFEVVNRARGNLETYARNVLEGAGVDARSPSRHLLAAAKRLGVGVDSRVAKALNIVTLRMALERGSRSKNVVLWNVLPSRHLLPGGSNVVVYDHGLSSLKRPYRDRRESLTRASGLIAISRANEFILRERWDWQGRIDVIMNPLRGPIAEAALVDKARSSDRIILGCASRLISKKGIASAVHAVKILKDRGRNAQLRIAGDGPEADVLRKIADDLNLGDRVVLLGAQHDMVEFYNGIDVMIAPSLREPFGLTPLESLAMGVPTILSAVDGHPEVLPFEGAATLIEPTLPIARYLDLGASAQDLPEFVYSPSRGQMTATRALDPADIADAVAAIADDFGTAARTARKAGEAIRQRNAIDPYVDQIVEATRG